MILRINGNPLTDVADWVIDKEAELIVSPIKDALSDWIHAGISALNANSPEIITLCVVICGIGLMVGPILGNGPKWFGRLFVTLFGGVVWRVLT